MITLKIRKEDESSFHLDLYEKRRIQSFSYRYAYNRLKNGASQKEMYYDIKDKFKLQSWFNRSAIIKANKCRLNDRSRGQVLVERDERGIVGNQSYGQRYAPKTAGGGLKLDKWRAYARSSCGLSFHRYCWCC